MNADLIQAYQELRAVFGTHKAVQVYTKKC